MALFGFLLLFLFRFLLGVLLRCGMLGCGSGFGLGLRRRVSVGGAGLGPGFGRMRLRVFLLRSRLVFGPGLRLVFRLRSWLGFGPVRRLRGGMRLRAVRSGMVFRSIWLRSRLGCGAVLRSGTSFWTVRFGAVSGLGCGPCFRPVCLGPVGWLRRRSRFGSVCLGAIHRRARTGSRGWRGCGFGPGFRSWLSSLI